MGRSFIINRISQSNVDFLDMEVNNVEKQYGYYDLATHVSSSSSFDKGVLYDHGGPTNSYAEGRIGETVESYFIIKPTSSRKNLTLNFKYVDFPYSPTLGYSYVSLRILGKTPDAAIDYMPYDRYLSGMNVDILDTSYFAGYVTGSPEQVVINNFYNNAIIHFVSTPTVAGFEDQFRGFKLFWQVNPVPNTPLLSSIPGALSIIAKDTVAQAQGEAIGGNSQYKVVSTKAYRLTRG